MVKPRNLFYGFQGSIEREALNNLLGNIDKIVEMPLQENRDIQMENSNGKNEVDYTCYFEKDSTIKIEDGLLH